MSDSDKGAIVVAATYRNLASIGSWIQEQLSTLDEKYQAESTTELSVFDDIELALHEICNNIIDHAYGHERGKIELCFDYYENTGCVCIDIYDRGSSFNVSEVKPPDLSQPQVGGYGLFLAEQLLDELHYTLLQSPEPDTATNHWRLVKYLR